jgi:hypothetical protein
MHRSVPHFNYECGPAHPGLAVNLTENVQGPREGRYFNLPELIVSDAGTCGNERFDHRFILGTLPSEFFESAESKVYLRSFTLEDHARKVRSIF